MRQTWGRLYSEATASQVAGQLPRVPVKGRRGSVTDAEKSVLKADKEELISVFHSAVVLVRAKGPCAPTALRDEVGEPEDAYSERLNKWVRDAYA
eukprot:7201804-Alexandrium_andersonii.AAC.1